MCCRDGTAGSSEYYCSYGVDARKSECCTVTASDVSCKDKQAGYSLGFSAGDYVTDSNSFTPSYSITKGGDGLFSVDEKTGALFLIGDLDFEKAESHSIRIGAEDRDEPCLSGFFDVIVTVGNDNDNEPSIGGFIPGGPGGGPGGAEYENDEGASACTNFACIEAGEGWVPGDTITMTVDEDAPVGTELATFNGVDRDGDDITYALADAGNRRRAASDTLPFAIDGDGTITTTAALDAQTKAMYKVLIVVTDGLKTFTQPSTILIETVACEEGFFSKDGSWPCEQVTVCDEAAEYEAYKPTSKSDRVCKETTPCEKGISYMTFKPTPTEDRKCAQVTQCAENEFEAKPPTWTTDRECQTYTKCAYAAVDAKCSKMSRGCAVWPYWIRRRYLLSINEFVWNAYLCARDYYVLRWRVRTI